MLALYRKYRPKTLDEVIGEEQVTKPLSSALGSGKISHSYLFTGPRGCGKTSVARIMAHAINQFEYELEDSYLDIIEIDAASNTGVDNIRELREKAAIAPSSGQYKVYIIDEVHMLSKSAFNALLKTIEEPPKHVVFIMATTDLDKVPATIISRSQVFHFRLAPPAVIIPHLQSICEKEEIKITDAALKLIAEKGGGSFRDSLSLLDQISSLCQIGKEITEEMVASTLGLPLESKLQNLFQAYIDNDFTLVNAQLKDFLNEGIKPESIANSALARIIAEPTPELLPLLGSLPKVSAPFPEAKLLLAFLNGLEPSPKANKSPRANNGLEKISKVGEGLGESSEANKNSKQSSEAKSSRVNPSSGREENILSSTSYLPARTTTYIPDGTEKVAKRTFPDSQRMTSSAENGEVEKNIRPQALEDGSTQPSATLTPALKKQLEKCQIEETEEQIDIYPSKSFIKTILDRPGNQEVLKKFFAKPFVIHEPEDRPVQNSPTLHQISDIMGGIEEVKNNGGVPF